MKENLPSNIQKSSKLSLKAEVFKPAPSLTIHPPQIIEIPKLSEIDAKHEKDPKYCSIYASSVLEKQFKLESQLMKELDRDIVNKQFRLKRSDYFSNVLGIFYETLKVSERYATLSKQPVPQIDFSNLFLELQVLDRASRKINITEKNAAFVLLGSCLIGEKCQEIYATLPVDLLEMKY